MAGIFKIRVNNTNVGNFGKKIKCTVEHIARKVHDQNEHSTHVNFVNFTYLVQCFKDSI